MPTPPTGPDRDAVFDLLTKAMLLSRGPKSFVVTVDPETKTLSGYGPFDNDIAVRVAGELQQGMVKDDPELGNVVVLLAEWEQWVVDDPEPTTPVTTTRSEVHERVVRGQGAVLLRRLDALQSAIVSGDRNEIGFIYDQVRSAAERLTGTRNRPYDQKKDDS